MEAKSDIDSVDLFLEIENKDMLEMSWTTGFKLVNRCTSPKKSDSRHERERERDTNKTILFAAYRIWLNGHVFIDLPYRITTLLGRWLES